MTRTLLTAALLAALVAPASADVWKRASEPRDPTNDLYTALMQKGDDAAIAATADMASRSVQLRQVEIALEAYRGAARLRPQAAEPHFRIGSTLQAFFVDCETRPNEKREPPRTCRPPATDRASILRHQADRDVRSREMMEAWDAFEARAPLDSRVNE